MVGCEQTDWSVQARLLKELLSTSDHLAHLIWIGRCAEDDVSESLELGPELWER